MKRTEKQKGKTAAADRKRQITRYAVAAAAAIVVLLVLGLYLSGPSGAKNGDTVMVYYTGTFGNGTVFDSNLDRDPLIFTIGNGTVIPGFEEALVGMAPITTKTVNIPAEKAYGPYREDLIFVMNRTALPKEIEPVAGGLYTIRRDDGAFERVRVLNVTSDTVTLDQNHLLAGQNLRFTIRFAGFYQG